MRKPGDPLAELKGAIAGRRAVLVAGTGVSIAASGGHPQASWAGLLKHGIAWLRSQDLMSSGKPSARLAFLDDPEAETHHFISAAQDVTKFMGGVDSVHFAEWLRETVGTLPLVHREGVEALGALADHGNLLATTNYDG